MPVVDADGKLVGIVSDGDLLRRHEPGTVGLPSWASYVLDAPEQRAANYRKIHGLEARDVMTGRLFRGFANCARSRRSARVHFGRVPSHHSVTMKVRRAF